MPLLLEIVRSAPPNKAFARKNIGIIEEALRTRRLIQVLPAFSRSGIIVPIVAVRIGPGNAFSKEDRKGRPFECMVL